MPTVEQVLEEIEAKERERKLADSQTTPLLQFMKVLDGPKILKQTACPVHTIWLNLGGFSFFIFVLVTPQALRVTGISIPLH
jgi:hypothetical protein